MENRSELIEQTHPTNKQILTAFLLNIAAGSSTCLGGLVIFHLFNESVKHFQEGFTENSTAKDVKTRLCRKVDGEIDLICQGNSQTLATFCFILGCLIIFLLDILVHRLSPHSDRKFDVNEIENLHQTFVHSEQNSNLKDENVLLRENFNQTEILTALAIIIHNIPEGIATFIGAIEGTKLGWMLTMRSSP